MKETMKKVFLFLIVAITLAACIDRNVSVKITGDIHNGGNQQIQLALITADGMELMDSTYMKNGHFEFKISSEDERIKGRENAPMLFQLFLSEENSLATMAKKGERLKITADAQDLVRTYQISGGEEAELMHQLDSALTAFVIPAEKLFESYNENMYDDSVKTSIEAQYMPMLQHHRQYLKDFIDKHPNNMACYIAFFQSYNRRTFFNPMQDLDLLKKINANMMKVYPESEYVIGMTRMVEMLKSQVRATE